MLNKKLSNALRRYPKNFILFLIENDSINHCISRIDNKIKHDFIKHEYDVYNHRILSKKALEALDKPGLQGFDEYMKLSREEDKLWEKITSYHDKVHKSFNEMVIS